jgi:hypothetical protein
MGFLGKLFGKRSKGLSKEGNSFQSTETENQDNQTGNIARNEFERMINELVKEDYENFDYLKTDPMFYDAARLVVQKQQGSTSLIQRTFSIGYSRAGRIIDQLEEFGIVGPFFGDTARTVNYRNIIDLEYYFKKYPNLRSKKELFYEQNKELIEQRRKEYLKGQHEENDRLEKEAIKQKMLEKERRKRLHKEALNELIQNGEIFNHFTNKQGKRESIPQDVMDKVWNRDGGRCVKCGSQENLEFDHIIPFSKGGATTYRNMQLLCKKCNLEKTNRIGHE